MSTEYTDEITCPHCGYEFSDSCEVDDSCILECEKCNKEFECWRETRAVYTTSKIKTPNQ